MSASAANLDHPARYYPRYSQREWNSVRFIFPCGRSELNLLLLLLNKFLRPSEKAAPLTNQTSLTLLLSRWIGPACQIASELHYEFVWGGGMIVVTKCVDPVGSETLFVVSLWSSALRLSFLHKEAARSVSSLFKRHDSWLMRFWMEVKCDWWSLTLQSSNNKRNETRPIAATSFSAAVFISNK